jgi:hypothetical protein
MKDFVNRIEGVFFGDVFLKMQDDKKATERREDNESDGAT